VLNQKSFLKVSGFLGQSGDELKVKRINREVVVEKSSKNSRLKLQYGLHQEFLRAKTEDVRILLAPKIKKEFARGKYEMEFIFGQPLGFALENLPEKKMVGILHQIEDHLRALMDRAQYVSSASHDLKAKFSELEKQLHAFGLPISAISRLNRFESDLENSFLPQGLCHGDFSLENILHVNSTNNLVMLDFLDSPIQTPMIDFGRFWLDVNYGWWLSNSTESTTSWLNRQKLRRIVLKIAADYEIPVYLIDQFAFFAALRILPYTQKINRLARLKLVIMNSVYGRVE
jgi:hypothetical protein